MKKLLTLAVLASLLVSCSKESNYKYSYQLSGANKKQMVFEKLPFIGTTFITENQNDLERLNEETLIRWNVKDGEKVYRIDTSWVEKANCMGCKLNWK